MTPDIITLGKPVGNGYPLGVEIADQARSTGAQTARRIVNSLRDRGVLIGSEGPRANVLKLRPPMPFRPEHADIVIAALEAVLPELPQSLGGGPARLPSFDSEPI